MSYILRYYYLVNYGPQLTHADADQYCQHMHPNMVLAELEQTWEYHAVLTNYIITPTVKGTFAIYD